MEFVSTLSGLLAFACSAFAVLTTGCVAFEPVAPSKVENLDDRPYIAVLPLGFDLEITRLSTVKTVEETFSPEEELQQVTEALQAIQQETRWLFLSRLATGVGFRFVSIEEVDRLAAELDFKPGVLPNAAQVDTFRHCLGADLVVAGSILDYGKVRWYWLAAGLFADISWETTAIGLATAWNPALILGNLGFELVTSVPLWFGGGYVFGVAMRPIRVEMRAFETRQGYPIWQTMDESVYAWGALKKLPEALRDKKEVQLHLNMAETMESMGDALTKQGFMRTGSESQQELVQR